VVAGTGFELERLRDYYDTTDTDGGGRRSGHGVDASVVLDRLEAGEDDEVVPVADLKRLVAERARRAALGPVSKSAAGGEEVSACRER
jgi:hypothetical protein